MTSVAALDLGTTGVRALVLDEGGRVRGQVYRSLRTSFPSPGRVEQDPTELWESSLEVLRGALGAAGLPARELAGLGVVTQRASVLAWDAVSGRPLAPLIGWQDQRTADEVARLQAAGIPINSMASCTKLAWLLEHEPAVQKAAGAGTLRLGTPDTWITWQLTGGAAHVTDPGQAACTGLFDPAAGAFAPGLGQLFGVALDPLPAPVPTSAVVAETPAALLGAPVPVAARAGDQQASAFGQGVHREGLAKLTLGTAGMLDVHTGEAPAAAPPAAFPLPLWKLGDEPTVFCVEGQVITCGAAVDWLADLGIAADGAAAAALADQAPDTGGVVFVPALQGLGTPFGEEQVRGGCFGLTRGTSRAALARAVLEGIAHRCIDVIEAMELPGGPIRVDGGLGRSQLLLQTLADAADRELLRAAETEATATGAAHLAGLATGVWKTPEACAATTAAPTRFSPGPGAADRERARSRWRRALERVRS